MLILCAIFMCGEMVEVTNMDISIYVLASDFYMLIVRTSIALPGNYIRFA